MNGDLQNKMNEYPVNPNVAFHTEKSIP